MKSQDRRTNIKLECMYSNLNKEILKRGSNTFVDEETNKKEKMLNRPYL